jgi:hypothetical protein
MHMIEPIHGQPPSGYHAPPNPIHYHILGLTTKLERRQLARAQRKGLTLQRLELGLQLGDVLTLPHMLR